MRAIENHPATWIKALATCGLTAWALLATGCGDGDKVQAKVESVHTIPIVQPVILPSVEPRVEVGEILPLPPQVAVMPEKYEDRIATARKLAKQGLHEEAEAMYVAALQLEQHAAPMVEIARLALMRSDVPVARKYAEEAVDLAPESSGAWNTLGRVELMDGDKLAAVAAFTRATDCNPDNGYAWNNLGLVLSQLRRYDEAVAALENATASADVQTYMWNNLGIAYEGLEQHDLARAAYKMAARKGSPEAKHALARLTDDGSEDDDLPVDPEHDQGE